eukprot:TRINITY_DN1414_c4_g1_i1.p1 TRINITY_DN1414_c4_g1~~TRINITY_DN1414_c4_g1_i1.p1  ORF type:complete len:414 (+),score=86.66 TRINITY_DN1414_c4_g1_i1:310-1551(+)
MQFERAPPDLFALLFPDSRKRRPEKSVSVHIDLPGPYVAGETCCLALCQCQLRSYMDLKGDEAAEIEHIEAKEHCSCIAPPKFSFPYLPYATRARKIGFPNEYLLLRSDIPESLLVLSTDKIMKNLRICAACNGRFWHRVAKMKQAAEIGNGRQLIPFDEGVTRHGVEGECARNVNMRATTAKTSVYEDQQVFFGPIRTKPVRPVPIRSAPYQRIDPSSLLLPSSCSYMHPTLAPTLSSSSSTPGIGISKTVSWANGHTLSPGSLGSDDSKDVIMPVIGTYAAASTLPPTGFEDWPIVSRHRHKVIDQKHSDPHSDDQDHLYAKKVMLQPWTHSHHWIEHVHHDHPSSPSSLSKPQMIHPSITWDHSSHHNHDHHLATMPVTVPMSMSVSVPVHHHHHHHHPASSITTHLWFA